MGLGSGEESKIEGPGKQCPSCGYTQADFKKTGRLGCSVCWEVFETGMSSLLKAVHKGVRHVGKVPSKALHTMELSEKIKQLSEELNQAVAAEKYEDAAQIRDHRRQRGSLR